MAKKKKIFEFNLLPPKSEELSRVEKERDDSLIYSIVLVFFGLLVYFGLLLAENQLIEPRVTDAEAARDSRQVQLSNFDNIRTLNGELFIKTSTLDVVLDRDLSAEEIFRVGEIISSIDPNVGIITYARQQSGLFVFDFIASDISLVVPTLEAAQAVNGVSDAFLSGVQVLDNGRVRLSIELNIANA